MTAEATRDGNADAPFPEVAPPTNAAPAPFGQSVPAPAAPNPGAPPAPGLSAPGVPAPAGAAPAAPVPSASPVPAPAAGTLAIAARPAAGATSARQASAPAVPATTPGSEPEDLPHVRVDGRLVESAILALRKPIVAAALPFEEEGVDEARAERRKLLSQIDDYLLPRLRESGAPILVALVGSTGAGKSTLVNSLVGAEVSVTGVRRPTTNSPVLACHPDDVGWFAENVFLPTVPRVRQHGLARSGRDGLLVLAASAGLPKGVALLDTPDIDSVVQAHREFAHQFLDASDLWLFATTAGRYADASVWEMLAYARDRGAALGIVLSRLPQGADEILGHFAAMLEANGLGDRQRFLIPETELSEGRLPPELSGPVREWLESTATQVDRRVAVLTQTMSGMLDTFRVRVPELAARVEAQAALRADLGAAVDGAYRAALAEVERDLWGGSMLRGEVLAGWQELAGAGDLLRALQARRGGARPRRQRGADRVQSLNAALRAAIESMILSVGDRAAEDAVARWRDHPAGAALLDQPQSPAHAPAWGAQLAADMTLLFGPDADPAGQEDSAGPDGSRRADALARSSPDLARHAALAVGAWQRQVVRLVREEIVTKRSFAKSVTLDDESLATVLMVALLAGRPEDESGTSAIPGRLLTTLFGAGPLRHVTSRAQADLQERIRLIFEEEMLRFGQALAAAGAPDPAVAVQLYQATYSLEMVR